MPRSCRRGRRQHQCADHHDCREGGGLDQGGVAAPLVFERNCRAPWKGCARWYEMRAMRELLHRTSGTGPNTVKSSVAYRHRIRPTRVSLTVRSPVAYTNELTAAATNSKKNLPCGQLFQRAGLAPRRSSSSGHFGCFPQSAFSRRPMRRSSLAAVRSISCSFWSRMRVKWSAKGS